MTMSRITINPLHENPTDLRIYQDRYGTVIVSVGHPETAKDTVLVRSEARAIAIALLRAAEEGNQSD